MIYRIDLKHFLTHAIDYFTYENITNANYVIISAKIRNGGRSTNVVKYNEFYPPVDIVMLYNDYPDTSVGHDAYLKMLEDEALSHTNTIYDSFVKQIIDHKDIIIICDESENMFVDVFVEYIDKKYNIPVIDLNQLFTTGRTDEIYIDRTSIKEKAVSIRRKAAKAMRNELAATKRGRESLVAHMSKKEKVYHLKKLGIEINKSEEKNIDQILLDAWDGDSE